MYRRVDLTGKTLDTYSRISFDPEQNALGVTRQDVDTEARLKELGATLGVRQVENDTSAYRKKKVSITDHYGNTYAVWRVIRPVWAEALQRLRRGESDGLMVDDLDRLARDPRDLEDAIEVVEHYGKLIISATASEIDLSSPSGILSARLVVNMANKASADTARRVKTAHRHRAMSGKPSTSGTRPFGWRDDRLTLEPLEAQAVRDGLASVIRGIPLNAIAKQWNSLGMKTPRGGEWDFHNVKTVLTRPRVAGLATLRGEVLKDADGNSVTGQWEAIVSREEFDKAQAILKARARPRRRRGKYLLGSVLVCGLCGAQLWGNVGQGRREDGSARGSFYACKQGHNSVNQDLLETIVDLEVGNRYAKIKYFRDQNPQEFGIEPDFPKAMLKADLEVRAQAMMRDYYALANTSTRASVGMELLAQVGEIRDRIADLEHEEALWKVEQEKLKGSNRPLTEWGELDHDTRRAYIEDYCDAIVIAKTYAGDPAVERRVSIQWSRVATPWGDGPEPSSVPNGGPDLTYSTYPEGVPQRLKGRGSRSPHMATARELLAQNPHVSSTEMMKASGLGRYQSQTLLALARREKEWGQQEDEQQARARVSREKVARCMGEHPEWSGRRIAKELGMSSAYVCRLKKEIAQTAQGPTGR